MNNIKRPSLFAARYFNIQTVSLLVFACSVLVGSYSCAYFNKLYNAKKKYREAQAMPIPKDGSLSRQQIGFYDEVIEKCQELIVAYPNSRWLDDALLLMGKSYYAQKDYDETIQTMKALKKDFPESDLNEEAQEYLARSHLGKGKPEAAVEVLKSFLEKYPKSRRMAVALYLLGTTSLQVGNEEEAMSFLGRLASEYPKNPNRLKADLEMAEIFLEKQEYEKSLIIYERLASTNLEGNEKIRCLTKLAETYVKLERFEQAREIIVQIDNYVLPLEDKADEQLLKAETYVGLDSLEKAIETYLTVGASYPKTKFSAEGYYRLGIIHQEKLDSLEAAKGYYEKVRSEYAKSPFAEDALKRSSDISKLLRLQNSLGKAGEEEKAFAKFSLAEIQLFQFNNLEKALIQYEAVLDSFPESVVAPKAAFAIGYIYGILMGDTLKAREAYEFLINHFPDSQQAAYSWQFLGEAKE